MTETATDINTSITTSDLSIDPALRKMSEITPNNVAAGIYLPIIVVMFGILITIIGVLKKSNSGRDKASSGRKPITRTQSLLDLWNKARMSFNLKKVLTSSSPPTEPEAVPEPVPLEPVSSPSGLTLDFSRNSNEVFDIWFKLHHKYSDSEPVEMPQINFPKAETIDYLDEDDEDESELEFKFVKRGKFKGKGKIFAKKMKGKKLGKKRGKAITSLTAFSLTNSEPEQENDDKSGKKSDRKDDDEEKPPEDRNTMDLTGRYLLSE